MRIKLPAPGIVGQYHDDRDHAVAAAYHVTRARERDTQFTPAYLALAKVGAAILAKEATNEDLVS